MPSLTQCNSFLDNLTDKGLNTDEIAGIKKHFAGEFKRLEAAKAEGRADMLLNDLEGMRTRGDEFSDRLLGAALEQKRHAAVNIVTRRTLDAKIADWEAQGFDFMESLTALMVGSQKVNMQGGRNSVDAKGNGVLRTWVVEGFYDLREKGVPKMLCKDKQFRENVHREMISPDSTSDQLARETAQTFSDMLERARQTANRFGFNIGKLEGYAPQNHDALKITRMGFDKWFETIAPLLDVARSFSDIAGDTAAFRERMRFAYKHITTGRSRQDGALYTGGTDITAKSGAHRVLFFKDADASIKYHAEFGIGGVQDGVLRQLRSLSRGVALIETFGPNPEMMVTSLINAKLETLGASEIDTKLAQRLQKTWNGGRAGMSGRLDRYFATLTGDADGAANLRVAQVAGMIRKQQSMSSLGGATLSAIADVFIKAMAYRFRGDNLFSGYYKAITEFYLPGVGTAKGDALKAMHLMGAFADTTIGSITNRFDGGVDGAIGKADGFASGLMDWFFKASFLTQWTEAHKTGYIVSLGRELGLASADSFDKFNPHMQAVLARYGVDVKRWDLWRKLNVDIEGLGTILSPERAHALPDADFLPFIREDLRSETATKGRTQDAHDAIRRNAIARERDRLESELMSFFAEETHYAIIEPDARTRATMTGGHQRGTTTGEIYRFVMQFKSFPINYMQRVMAESRWRRAADSTNFMSSDNLLGITQFAMGAMVFGYIAMTAKDAAKGKTPRDPEKMETWFAAAMQGGGAGIFGDFLFEPVNRFGGGFIDTLAGPTAGAVGDSFRAIQNLIRGEVADAGSDALRTALDNTPFVNLWYTRAALDYGLLFHVREMLSPGSMRRMEQRAKQVYGQDYFLPPSQVINRGGGFK